MIEIGSGRWETARHSVIERWRKVLQCIDAEDDRGVMGLISAKDEFCDEATADRKAMLGTAATPIPVRGDTPGTDCHFCRGFTENGGCLGAIDDVERAVYEKRWEDARALAEEYIAKLKGLQLGGL